MIPLRYINKKYIIMENLIPIFGILSGMVVPIAVFIWLYLEGKGKREMFWKSQKI